METPPGYVEARLHVRAMRALYLHAAAYVIANLFLFAVDLLTPGNPWFYWPLLGWGVGLAAHAVVALLAGRMSGGDWEDRKARAFLARHGRA